MEKYKNPSPAETISSLLTIHSSTVDLLNNTIRVLKDITTYSSPLKKLHILHTSFKDIESVLLKTSNDLSADIKWPVILHVVFKAEMPHLYSSAMMLKNFYQSYQFENELMERASLHVTELISVAAYILYDLV